MVQAVEAYRSVSASEEFRELERLRDRARRNEASALANAEVRGVVRGGQEKALEIAKKMKARGDSISAIEGVTGLTVDDILCL